MTEELIAQSFVEVELTQPLLMQFYRCIATNIIRKIKQLQLDQEYTIPTGWSKHAVCVSFRRISQTHIYIRVDNPSSCNPLNAHRIDRSTDNYHRIKPRILGHLHVNDLENNLDYFISLIDSVKRDLTLDEGVSLIYNLNKQIRNLNEKIRENVPNFVEQAAANCFVKCFEPGFRRRIGITRNRLCEQLMSFEKESVNLLVERCEENYRRGLNGSSNCFASLSIEYDANNLSVAETTRLLEQLKTCYQQHYRHLSNILTRGDCNPLTERYVPLQLERDNTPIAFESLFIETRVLVLGEAGCGKTTVCQHVTYSWACARIWQSKFEWLFYIKMRNLNSKLYPLQSNYKYSLIDIIERECFQGYKLVALDKLKLKSQLAYSSNILWILDALDERTIPDHLYSIKQELLTKPHLLLISRPCRIYDFQYDICVRIQGFTYQDIEKYINKYFSIMFRTAATECWSFIRCSEQLLQTARIPACLEIICNLWDSRKEKLDFGMTMGQLYQKMCEYLLRRYLLKFHGQCKSALAGRDVYGQSSAIGFTHLEHLAFKLTKSNRFTVSRDEIISITRSLFLSVFQIGLLIPKTPYTAPVLVDNIYYFVHRSFQEYLCARYTIKALALFYSKEEKKEVFQFITDEKYNRRVRDTFRLFFELERSSLCNDQFWSAVDSETRDLVGLRHCSRIIQWFPKGSCIFSLEDEQQINKRTTDTILRWISKKDRLAHDYGNTYLFEWFFGVIDDEYWLAAWKEDLFIEDSSKRHYFLPELWSMKNIDTLKEIYDDVPKNVEALYDLIKKGPTSVNLRRLHIASDLFTLYTVDDKVETSDVMIAAQKKAREREPITTLAEFQALLQNYASFANLNRRAMALGMETWRLNIAASALKNIDNETLALLLQLSQQNALFSRDFRLPVISFLELYAKQSGLNDDILRSLIVLISFSSEYLLTVPPSEKKLIRVYDDDKFVDIELDQQQWYSLIDTFNSARDAYGYSSYFKHDD